MKKIHLMALVLVSSLFLSSGAMAFNGSDLAAGKGFSSIVSQNVAWKFSWDNLFDTFRPGNQNRGRPAHPGNGNGRGKGNPNPGRPENPGRPGNPGNSNPGGGHHSVPEMDAAGGIIAFSLMLSLFGFFREKRKQLSVS